MLVERVGREGWAVAHGDGLTVALDTTLDAELEVEKRVLDLIHELNAMRKDAGLELTDRIVVTLPQSARPTSWSTRTGSRTRCSRSRSAPTAAARCPRSRRHEALRVGPRGDPGVRRLPRRGVGRPVARRASPVRDADARGRAGRALVADHPAQARGVSEGVRELRCGEGRPVREARRGAAARRPGHRAQPAQGRVDREQRAADPRARRSRPACSGVSSEASRS